MLFFYVNNTERSSDVSNNTLSVINQMKQRSDSCSFEVFQGTAPAANEDLRIYDGDFVASQAGAILTLQGKFQPNVNKFRPGQAVWLRLGQANTEKAYVQNYTETVAQGVVSSAILTLEDTPAFAVSNGDEIGELVFGGVVARVKDKNLQTLENLLWDVTGVDYSKIFDKKIVGDTWADVDARYIINDFANTTVNYNSTVDNLSYASNAAIQAVWIESLDGSNPTVDALEYLEATSSGVFPWVHTGSNEAVWTAAISSRDISAFTGVATGSPTKGSVMLWAKVGALANMSTIKLRLGSSSVNYAEVTLTPTVEGDWGYLTADLDTATIVGVPNWAVVVHAQIRVAESATDSIRLNGFRVNDQSSFTLFNVQPSPAIADYRAPQIKPTQLVNDLANAFDFTWYIDYERDIHFLPSETTLAPFDVTDTTDNFYDMRIDTDVSNLGNRIIVNGASQNSTSRYSQIFQGDGAIREWVLKSPFADPSVKVDNGASTKTTEAGTTTTSVKITAHGFVVGDWIINRTRSNAGRQILTVPDADHFTVQAITAQTSGDTISYFAITQTIGVEGVDDETLFDYMGNSPNQSARASTQTATLPTTSFIQFEYNEVIPIQIQYTDTASANTLKALGLGDGIFDLAPVTDLSIKDFTTAVLTAQARVAQFSNAIITGTLRTDQRGLRSGQLLSVTQTIERNFSATYVIQRVGFRQQEGLYKDYLTFDVTFATTLFGWIELIQKLLRAGQNLNANTTQIVETFVSANETMEAEDVNATATDGGFLNAKNTETPVASDSNATYLTTPPWQWEPSVGQAIATRWDLFEWG